MKRTKKAYLTYDSEHMTAQHALNQESMILWHDKPKVPYLEVEIKVVYNEKAFSHQRSSFLDKLGTSIIIPNKFTGEKK